jgi:hypothetical protein
MEKGPEADATDAPQPWGLSCNPVVKMIFFLFFRIKGHPWNETDRENRSTWGKTCPSATLSTMNPTLIEPGSNQGLCGERPVDNRLNYGTALQKTWIFWSLSFPKRRCFLPYRQGWSNQIISVQLLTLNGFNACTKCALFSFFAL